MAERGNYDDYILTEEEDAWSWMKTDLNAFFNSIYNYHEQKGFMNILVNKFLTIAIFSTAIGIIFSLAVVVDWETVLITKDLSQSIRFPISTVSVNLLIATIAVTTSVYFVKSLFDLRNAWRIRSYLKHALRINDDMVITLPWPRIVKALANDTYRCGNGDKLTELNILNIMMRRDNYLIAMVQSPDVFAESDSPLSTRVAEWCFHVAVSNYLFSTGGRINDDMVAALELFGTQSRGSADSPELQICIDECYTTNIATPKSEKNGDGWADVEYNTVFKNLVWTTKKRLFWTGAIFLLISPAVLLVILCYTFLTYAAQLKTTPSMLGLRTWARMAYWKFRNYNEVPAVLVNRLHAAHGLAENYVNQFPAVTLNSILQSIQFCLGILVAVLIFLSFVSDTFLLVTIIGNRSVLWFLGVFTGMLGIIGKILPSETFVYEPEVIMKKLVEVTDYSNSRQWLQNPYSKQVRASFGSYFDYKIKLWFNEMWAVIYVPIQCMTSLQHKVEAIIKQILKITYHDSTSGYICKMSAFSPDSIRSFQTQQQSKVTNTVESVLPPDYISDIEHDKMQKSMIAWTKTYSFATPNKECTQ